MQVFEERCDVRSLRLVKDHSHCCILDQLQKIDSTCWKACQESITRVQTGQNNSVDKELCSMLRQEGPGLPIIVAKSVTEEDETSAQLSCFRMDNEMPSD